MKTQTSLATLLLLCLVLAAVGCGSNKYNDLVAEKTLAMEQAKAAMEKAAKDYQAELDRTGPNEVPASQRAAAEKALHKYWSDRSAVLDASEEQHTAAKEKYEVALARFCVISFILLD